MAIKKLQPPLICKKCLKPVFKSSNGHAVWYCCHVYGGTQVITKLPITRNGFYVETDISKKNFERQAQEIKRAQEVFLSQIMGSTAEVN